MISETPHKLFKFYIKHHLEFELNFSFRTAPVSEIVPIRYPQEINCINVFVLNQKTLINTKMVYKRKLSSGNLLDMWPKYGHLSDLAEMMEFSSFDVVRQHRKPRDGPAFYLPP